MNVLILEDDFDLGFQWQEALEARGHRVTLTDRAAEAISLFDKGGTDAFVSDMMIRDPATGNIETEGGLTVIGHMKLSLISTPRIVAVSGSPPELKVLHHARGLGADYAFQKPVAVDNIVSAVEAVPDGESEISSSG